MFSSNKDHIVLNRKRILWLFRSAHFYPHFLAGSCGTFSFTFFHRFSSTSDRQKQKQNRFWCWEEVETSQTEFITIVRGLIGWLVDWLGQKLDFEIFLSRKSNVFHGVYVLCTVIKKRNNCLVYHVDNQREKNSKNGFQTQFIKNEEKNQFRLFLAARLCKYNTISREKEKRRKKNIRLKAEAMIIDRIKISAAQQFAPMDFLLRNKEIYVNVMQLNMKAQWSEP